MRSFKVAEGGLWGPGWVLLASNLETGGTVAGTPVCPMLGSEFHGMQREIWRSLSQLAVLHGQAGFSLSPENGDMMTSQPEGCQTEPETHMLLTELQQPHGGALRAFQAEASNTCVQGSSKWAVDSWTSWSLPDGRACPGCHVLPRSESRPACDDCLCPGNLLSSVLVTQG